MVSLFACQEEAGLIAVGTRDHPVAPASFAGGDPTTGFPDPSTPSAFGTRYRFIPLTAGADLPRCLLRHDISPAQFLATPRIICYPG